MGLVLLLAQQILSMVFMVFCGFVLGKRKLVTPEQSRVLSCVCVYMMTPGSLIYAFSSGRDLERLSGMAISLFCGVVIHALYLAAAAILSRGDRGFTKEEQASVIYNNAGNLAIPMVQNILGPEYVIYNTPYILVQNFLLWTHGQGLMDGAQRLTIKKVVTNPVIASIGIGVILFITGIPLPAFLRSAAAGLGACVGPVSMVVTGVLMSEQDISEVLSNKRIYLVTLVRLIVFPIMIIPVLLITGQVWQYNDSTNVLIVNLLCAVGPSASTITQQAILWRNPHAGYVSSVNVLTTLCCVMTMPIISAIFLALI